MASKEKDGLVAELDELLERYLHTLNEYDKVRKELSKQLSSGYLSLAQANFHSNSSSMRYGQDYYDERMQAIRTINVAAGDDASEKKSFSTRVMGQSSRKEGNSSWSDQHDGAQEEKDETSSKTGDEPTTAAEPKHAKPEHTESDSTEKGTEKGTTKSTNPLHWFGILVPPALRTAQFTFISTVEGPIPQLACLTRDLRNQEIEIGRLRKQIKKL
ncbi:hypothetical protein IQ07DRAFT_496745 [Pyrenochaeta sp. DS3sAY3a]|nr:hypothetical protein IQ07DRAFT_496745 [Pyrenochaeta sp. DS3sAY3a]